VQAVRLGEPLGDLRGKGHRLPPRQRAVVEPLRQGAAVDLLEHQVVGAVELLEPVDGGDVGVAQGGQHPGFALEALQLGGIAVKCARQGLDGHLPIQDRIVGAIDLPHGARAEQAADLVAPEPGARHERRAPADLARVLSGRVHPWPLQRVVSPDSKPSAKIRMGSQ